MPRDGHYDPITHQYTWRGEPIVSVTQVLVRSGEIDTRFYNEAAADRGRRVHRFCELYDLSQRPRRKGEPVAEPLVRRWLDEYPDLSGYAAAYRAFTAMYQPVYTAIERPRYSARLRLGGRTDRIFALMRYCEGSGVLELKTGGEAEWHGLQLAGYQIIRGIGSRWAVYLKENGRFVVRRKSAASDYARFYLALEQVQRAVALVD